MRLTIISMLLGSSAAARYYDDTLIVVGAGDPGPKFGDSQSDEAYLRAITDPKATRSIKFAAFPGLLRKGNGIDDSVAEWTWEFAFPPGAREDVINATNVNNPHYVSATYDLQWPGGGNLSQALQGTIRHYPDAPFCVIAPDVFFPPNVTDLYTDENANSTDCTPVLGEECVQAIQSRANNVNFRDRCGTSGQIWSSLPECAATLGYASRYKREGEDTFASFSLISANLFSNVSNSSNVTDARWETVSSGQGFFGFNSGVIDEANATRRCLEAANGLQMLMISTTFENSGNSELLCMRVNTTDQSGGESAASALARVPWMMAVVVLSVLAVCI